MRKELKTIVVTTKYARRASAFSREVERENKTETEVMSPHDE